MAKKYDYVFEIREYEKIHIGDEVNIQVSHKWYKEKLNVDQINVAIDAPRHVRVNRFEVHKNLRGK